jgi:hypothetical protein
VLLPAQSHAQRLRRRAGKISLPAQHAQSGNRRRLFENVAALIPRPEERSRFLERFGLAGLLSAFEGGTDHIHMDYHRRDENGRRVSARSYLSMLKNPETGDVEAVVYTIDLTRVERYNQIFRIITDRSYDEVAVIDTEDNTVELLHRGVWLPEGNRLLDTEKDGRVDYDAARRSAAAFCSLAGEDGDYFDRTSLDTVKRELENSRCCEINILERPQGTRAPTAYISSDIIILTTTTAPY